MSPIRTRLASARVLAVSPRARPALCSGLRLLLFAVAYFLAFASLLATRFVPAVFTQNLPAPFFPPEGVILGALLLTPPRRWWGWQQQSPD